MDEVLELINNHIEEVLENPDLLQRVSTYLNSEFEFNIDNLKANPNVLMISGFIIPKIQENPSIVLDFPYELMEDDFSRLYLREAVINHFIPSFSEIEFNPNLGKFLPIGTLERLLRNEPRMLMYFPEEEIMSHSRGIDFVASEEDLLRVPTLRKIPSIMEISIDADHSLIKYLQVDIDEFIIDDALADVELTRDDFLANPELCTLDTICKGKYSIYYRYLTNDQKAVIVSNYISNGRIDELVTIPFLQHEFNPFMDSEIDVPKVIELIKSITPDLSRADEPNNNKENWNILNYVLDGIAAYRYKKSKQSFRFKSADTLVDRFEEYFREINSNNMDEIMDILAYEIMDFMETNDYENIFKSLKLSLCKVYKIYLDNNKTMPSLDKPEERAEITSICNYILNFHRDVFIEHEKDQLRDIISNTFKLKPDVIDQILREKRRDKALRIFREELEAGKHKNKLDELFYKKDIRDILRKGNIILSDEKYDEVFNYLVYRYINTGKLDKKEIVEYFESVGYVIPPNSLTLIIKKLNKEINKRAEKIELTKQEAAIRSVERMRYTKDFVAKNLSMTNKGITDFVLAELLIDLLDEPKRCKKAVKNIMSEENRDNIEILKRIIPFFGLISNAKELSTDMLMDIITYLPRIKSRINPPEGEKRIELYFEKIIGFATDYGKSSDLLKTVIATPVAEKLGDSNIGKYAEFYLTHMFNRETSTVPIVRGETSKYTFASRFKDQDRLLIGKMYRDSCIDLNDSSGVDTFTECLSGPNGDVILVRDRISNALMGRVLAVRRGNVLQLQLRNIDNSINDVEYQRLIRLIGKQVIDASIENDDNLDVVVVATLPHVGERDDRLKDRFPHADWGGFYEVVASKTEDTTFDFDQTPKHVYHTKRDRVREQATDQELSAMKAISIWLMPKSMEREDKERTFEPVNFEDTGYSVLLGEDWYIIHDEGKIIEEVVVPTQDSRQSVEIDAAKENYELGKGGTIYG